MLEHDTKIARPRQLYIGSPRRDYVALADRKG
jgi:citrate synthase